jgi:hypothetical protein
MDPLMVCDAVQGPPYLPAARVSERAGLPWWHLRVFGRLLLLPSVHQAFASSKIPRSERHAISTSERLTESRARLTKRFPHRGARPPDYPRFAGCGESHGTHITTRASHCAGLSSYEFQQRPSRPCSHSHRGTTCRKLENFVKPYKYNFWSMPPVLYTLAPRMANGSPLH